jgi:8-oxo-dGTP pyrophosphatase MutT (NUDIX family)
VSVVDRDVVPAVPAATVVLLRDGDDGLETLWARRRAGPAFGGFWVFPGGRVEATDVSATQPDELTTARRAAVREAYEEVGLVVSEEALVRLSHWTPPDEAPKRFTTWFFLAPVTDPSAEVVIDDGEIVDYQWVRPADAIRRRDAREMDVAPPTWVTLWRLTHAKDVADALALAAASEPERFVTRTVKTAAGVVLLQPGDAGYDTRDPDVRGARHRFLMYDGAWRYERALE